MNIGIVCYPTFGGSGVLATELGKALADKGHHIHFITYRQPVRLTGFSANIFYHEVHVPSYPLFDYPPYESALASTMVDVIRNNQLDLLHVHYAIPHAAAAYMAKCITRQEGIRIPVITTLHGTDITLVGRDKTYTPVVTFSINESDSITAVSENLRQETLANFRVEKPIDVIHNFVDVRRFAKKAIDAFRKVIAPEEERIVLHASNFRKVKRIEDVVRIFAGIRQQIPAKLLLVGDGPERPMAEELVRQLGLCDDVRMLGKQQDIEDIFIISDLFLLPSEHESFGLAALEAMAAGVPVVATDAGGIKEVVIPGVNGELGSVGDVQGMAAKAVAILQDPAVLEKYRSGAKAQAQHFDISLIVPKYEEVYERCLRASQTA